ncbi:sialidase family protein [Larkinella soli]|uniref:sialidase family protein n=1 Tax=Larkinella soli TaxID=1770527 RepID=UPI000FFB47C0|nr:sialidase family protein [Larkinella soli]
MVSRLASFLGGFFLLLSSFIPVSAQKPVRLPAGINASLPRFTTDHRGNPVISWVEKTGRSLVFCYSLSTDGGRTFGPKKTVPGPAEFSVHTEGKPKIAFKKDGTLIATFEVSRPTEEAPRAGDLLFVLSRDGGSHWTRPAAVHRDTSPGKSHSFSDLNRLPDGEVGIVFLDEKMPGQEGRSVKFAKTEPGGGFGPEVLIDSNACQCCRTSVISDEAGTLYIAYRDLLPDGSRDISYATSADGGRTFSRPQLVRADHWQIDACPHSGPQLVAAPGGVLATWYSGREGEAGIRLAGLGREDLLEKPRTSAMKFPQVAVLTDGRTTLCWEEWVGEGPGAYRKIGLKYFDKTGKALSERYLTPTGETAAQSTLLATPTGLLLAYTRLGETTSTLTLITLPD